MAWGCRGWARLEVVEPRRELVRRQGDVRRLRALADHGQVLERADFFDEIS